MGRQPWIVFGLQRVDKAVSPVVPPSAIWTSLLGFTLLYGALAVAGGYLLRKFARQGPVANRPEAGLAVGKGATLWN
jgi:cytochrome bd ubiquinol oxidase subunit I